MDFEGNERSVVRRTNKRCHAWPDVIAISIAPSSSITDAAGNIQLIGFSTTQQARDGNKSMCNKTGDECYK